MYGWGFFIENMKKRLDKLRLCDDITSVMRTQENITKETKTMKRLCGVKRIPKTEAEATLICQMFALPKMSLKKLLSEYSFTSEIPEVPYNEALADAADRVNEAANLI